MRRLARSLDGRFLPVDARKLDALCTRIARVTFVIYAAAAVEITSTMQLQQPSCMRLIALVAAAALRHTTALSPQHLRPRTVQLDDAWSVTVYEAKDIAASVEAWMATDEDCVDPFGGVAWPGSVMAARKLRDHGVAGKVVCCLGCGTGAVDTGKVLCFGLGSAETSAGASFLCLRRCLVGSSGIPAPG